MEKHTKKKQKLHHESSQQGSRKDLPAAEVEAQRVSDEAVSGVDWDTDFAALTPQRILYLQRTVGNAAVQRLITQRRPAQHPPAQIQRNPTGSGQGMSYAGYKLATHHDATVFFASHTAKLRAKQSELTDAGITIPSVLTDAIRRGDEREEHYSQTPQEAMGYDAVLVAMWWESNYVKGMNYAEAAILFETAKRLQEFKSKYSKVPADLQNNVLPALREAQRATFLASDDSKAQKVADAIGNVLDCSLALRELATENIETIAKYIGEARAARVSSALQPAANTRTGKFIAFAEKVNKAYAAFQLVQTSIGLLAGSKTEIEDATKGVKAMSTLISAGGTLLNASAGLGLYANLYVGPMVDQCLALLEKINKIGRDVNRMNIEQGDFDVVNWTLEPGGRPMFDFMLQVMKAGGPSGVPTPVPSEVNSFFVNQQSSFEAGISGKDHDLPTSGWWLWENVDNTKIARWVFRNRQDLWGMLYGDCRVP